MSNMKKILVYPCGTEIGLEIYKSLCFSTHYEIYGGSSSYDHGRFVYRNHIDGLPFINDNSSSDEIIRFNKMIQDYSFDFIYPAMDGVINIFAKYREYLSPIVIAPDYKTAGITRSKRRTYKILRDIIPVPEVYNSESMIKKFPVFIKPDIGQGSAGARKIISSEELSTVDFNSFICLEYLPGREFTIDCFTNQDGRLIYSRGRERRRIKNGISVNTIFSDEYDSIFRSYAQKINSVLSQRGGWFFQMKEAQNGNLKLLEAASRIAGTSAITRCTGVNLPLMTVNIFDGHEINDVIINDYNIELDRALENKFIVNNLEYKTIYLDYDDTLILHGKINTQIIKFLYQCINRGVKIVLLSKHRGSLRDELEKYRLSGIFDQIIHISPDDSKSKYITEHEAVFIDDSFGERRAVMENCAIPVFDTHMIKCLLEE